MKMMFIGADHEVTGSCHFLQACGKNMLIDYGMEQGINVYENVNLPVPPSDIDAVLLTHAHIDHSGLLPLLYGKGFRGHVYATKASCDLCDIMLRDSAHIQMFEAEWRNRKAKRAGLDEYIPIYDMEDVLGVLQQFVPCDYKKKFKIFDGITVEFFDVGHLLGSACIRVTMTESDNTKSVLFSGDVGNLDQPIIKDPSTVSKADYVVMESTYGDRVHSLQRPDYIKQLAELFQMTFARGGNVVIPSFAVGRTQEILYFIRKIKEDGLVTNLPDFSVYVDSPLAIEATNIFQRNIEECFDKEAMELVKRGINPIQFQGLKVSITSDDSKAINFDQKPKVIISASGMCEAGRIRHHLKHNLWRKESTILFVGYQANGTLGRALIEGAETVKIFGEEIAVDAQIMKLDGVSGHADSEGLIKWLKAVKPKPEKVFLVHGEDAVCTAFAERLSDEFGYNTEAPFSGAQYDLLTGECVYIASPIPMKVTEAVTQQRRNANAVFERLISAGKRLMTVITHNEGGANKDLAKFADQINSMCDKWDR